MLLASSSAVPAPVLFTEKCMDGERHLQVLVRDGLFASGEIPQHSTGGRGVGQLRGTQSTGVRPSQVYCASNQLYIHLRTTGPRENRLSKRRYKRRLLDLVVWAFEATTSARAAVSPTSQAGADAPTLDSVGGAGQYPTARSSTVLTPAATEPGGATVGVPIGAARAGEAPSTSTSLALPNCGPWILENARWTRVGDQSIETMSAARIEILGAERRAARVGVRRADRSAKRRAARIALRRAARSVESCAARLAVWRAARNASSGVAGRGASGAAHSTALGAADGAASAGSANIRPVAAACTSIWGWPSDWPVSPDFRLLNRLRSRVCPAPAEIGGVRDGAVSTLQDATQIVRDECEAVDSLIIAHCWVKSTFLPLALATDVTALHGEYRASSRSLTDDVIFSVVSLMGECRFGAQAFWDTATAARQMAMQEWLSVEDDEGVLAETADEILFGKTVRDSDARGARSEVLLSSRACDPEGTVQRRDELSDTGDSDDDGSEDLPQGGASESDGSEGGMDLEEA